METPVPVAVKWRDAFSGDVGWQYLEDIEPHPVEPVTLGWVFKEPPLEGYLTVYSTFYRQDDGDIVVSDSNHIPLGMVLDIKHLEL